MTMETAAARLCLVTDREMAGSRGLDEVVAAAVRGGVTMVQLREKTAGTQAFLTTAGQLIALLRPMRIPLVINDRVDIALAVDADGVHVGQDDMPVGVVRRLLGPEKIVGLSITHLSQLDDPDLAAADYLGIGPILAQATKADAAPPLGLEGLAAARGLTSLPLMAIGGISEQNAAAIRAHGADGLAVVSAIMLAADPEVAARRILRSD